MTLLFRRVSPIKTAYFRSGGRALFHVHDWRHECGEAIAKWSKRGDWDVDSIYVVGVVERCECGRARIKATGLNTVEVEA